MNISFQEEIPRHFNDDSHVWVYQCSRSFKSQEVVKIKRMLQSFIKNWKKNGIPVKSYADLFFDQFIIFITDETATDIKGKSAASSVKLIKDLEKDFQVELLDRLMHAFILQERIQILPLSELNTAIEKHLIKPETFYFNNTILTKKQLLNNWIIPVKESWLSKRIQ